ncbi:MAG: hypothetical protein QOF02_2183 [Blastocatellia bacterium]|jgi:hypothetical protein|nr:hypothetical protein [Blastocatellia bacterium]
MSSAEHEVSPDAEPEPASRGRLRRWLAAFLRLLPKARRDFGTPLAFLLSAVLLQLLAALFPTLTERVYAQSLYPHIVVALSSFSRRFNFSIGEALICLLLVVIFASILRLGLLLYWRPFGRLRRIVSSTRFALWCAGVCLWAFLFSFGFNYHRPLLFELLGFERREATAPELEAISGEVIRRINESYAEAHADGRAAPTSDEIVRLLAESYASVPELSLLPRGDFAPPKPVRFSEFLTRLGISGVYFPFTAEPNYNDRVPDFQLPFTIAHEMAHQRGVARESEANFVAFLVCVNSSDPFVRYSGYRNGVGVVSELFRVEPEQARELVRQLGSGYRDDSKRAALFWAKAGGLFGNLGLRLNDLYLRANLVRSGTADYARSTTLIIGYYLRTLRRTDISSS